MKVVALLSLLAACMFVPGVSHAQAGAQASIPHLEKRRAVTQLIVDGRPYLALAGEVHNSSSSNLAYMKPIWPMLVSAHLNTVLVPVSWELIEPEEGKYDFTLVDGLIKDAREHNLRLAFNWFGSWKNMVSSYAPVWVRANPDRFACAIDQAGNRLPVLSTFSDAACQADSNAFAALMRHVRQQEEAQSRKTVLMVQVENEVGLPGGQRDDSPVANTAFAAQVPPELMDYLITHKDSLYPDMKLLWEAAGSKTSGSWEQVFGIGPATPEIFMSWNYARYIGKVIAAGKAQYPIPMFVNASVGRQDGKIGSYPAGGPLAYVMDVWRAGAPRLDMLCPDIYYGSFAGWCEKYSRSGNPLFIPEMRAGATGTTNAMTAIVQYNAIGCSPFAIESVINNDEEYRAMYGVLSELSPFILQHQGDGTMAAATLDDQNPSQKLSIGPYIMDVEPVRRRDTTPEAQAGATPPTAAAIQGYALAINVGADEYVVAGKNVQITFSPNPPADKVAAVASIDEGEFVSGQWVAGRRLNGDETMLSYGLSQLAAGNQTGTGARFDPDKLGIYRIKLVQYRATAVPVSAAPDPSAAKDVPSRPTAPLPPGMTPIFDGKTLDGWIQEPPDTWIVKDGVIASRGVGRGVLYTAKQFGYYRVIFDIRHVSGMPDHQACVLFFGTAPAPGEKPMDALGAVQIQVPPGYTWDYRPGHNNAGPGEYTHFRHPKFDAAQWSRVELLINAATGTARMAVAQPVGSPAVEVVDFSVPDAGKVGPFALQMHNKGLFDEYANIVVEVNPAVDDLITVKPGP